MQTNEDSSQDRTVDALNHRAQHPQASVQSLHDEMREPWERTREARRAVTQAQFAPSNFDVDVAYVVMRGAYRRVLPFRSRIADELPRVDLRSLDMLPAYRDAMHYGHYRYVEQKQRRPPKEVNAEAQKLWRRLVDRLTLLAEDGLFPADVLERVRANKRWIGRADGLSRMAIVACERWSKIENRTTLTLKDFARATLLSDQLIDHLSYKGEPVALSEMEFERRQAIALAYNAYEDVRRAMAHLRWHEGDAHTIAPSVHRNSLTKRSKRRNGLPEDFDNADDAAGAGLKPSNENARGGSKSKG